MRQRQRRQRWIPLALLTAWLAPETPSPAQDVASSFSEVVDVRMVNLAVVVEDRKGDRVTGLGAKAFRLLVDGREVPVEQFAEIRGGRPVAAQPVSASNTPPDLLAGRAVGNSYVIYIDDYFAVAAQRNQVLRKLAGQLTRLRPKDRAAVVSFSGRHLNVLADLTGDRSRLARALDEAQQRMAFGLLRFSERQRLGLAVVPGSNPGFFTGESEYELRRERAAIVATMQAFADAPGRKILVALSGAWPVVVTSPYTRRSWGDLYENDLELLAPITGTANLLGFTIYPVDLPGFRVTGADAGVASDEHDFTGWRAAAGDRSQGAEGTGQAGANVPLFTWGQPFDTSFNTSRFRAASSPGQEEMLRQSSLRVVARDTGGRALFGAARSKALVEVADDTSSYYWLGFTPAREYDDDERQIRVEVAGGNFDVRTRRNFRDLSRRAQASMLTVSAALIDAGDRANELAVAVGAPQRAGFRKIQVGLALDIPLDRVTFLDTAGGYVSDLELRIAAADAADRHSEAPILPIRLVRSSIPRPGETERFETVVTLRSADRRLAVSLFDPLSGKALVATAEIER